MGYLTTSDLTLGYGGNEKSPKTKHSTAVGLSCCKLTKCTVDYSPQPLFGRMAECLNLIG